jgi:hypothetical protein
MMLNLLGAYEFYGVPPWALQTTGVIVLIGFAFIGFSFFGRRKGGIVRAERARVTRQREDSKRHGSGEERRRHTRRGGNPTPIQVKINRGRNDPWSAVVIDRSEGGLCLLLDHEVAPESRLTVRAPHAPEHVPWVDVQTRYCRPVGEQFQIGCEFVERLPLNVLLFFG